MFSRFFILRPVLSMVISIVIVIAGLVSMYASSIEQYPNIVPPSINISVTFPGADAETIANAVAAPIEDQMSGVPGMIYMQSSSANGNSGLSLNIYFDVGTDLTTVEADVLNRINTALPQLPTQVQQQGVTVRLKNPDLFLVVPFYTDDNKPDQFYLSNYIQRYVLPSILQIQGVGVAFLQGQRQFSMRVWLDPNKIAYYGLKISDIAAAIKDQNWPWAIGLNAMEPMDSSQQKFNYIINSPGYMTAESQFQNIVLRASESNAQVVRLKDVARVKLDPQNYNSFFKGYFRDKTGHVLKRDAVGLIVYLVPGANQIKVRHQIRAKLAQMHQYMPAGIKYYYHYDSSQFVILSIDAVVQTLIIAFILVFLVVMLFMQNLRGTIIPVIAIPVSIIGTFAGTYILGFSINTLTLFGMVLAIGIVVDDAIVVLENVERLMQEKKLSPVDAAIECMIEVSSPVIAVVAVLNAVFIPVAFLGGFTGTLMQQFAVTIAISTLLSGIVALTLTPTLCALMLSHEKDVLKTSKFKPFVLLNLFFTKFNNAFDQLRKGYLVIVKWLIEHIKVGVLLWVAVILLVIGMFIKIPESLIPLEDMGYYYYVQHVNNAGSMAYNVEQAESFAQALIKNPVINKIAVLGGLDLIDNGTNKTNTTSMAIILNDYDKRPKHETLNQVIGYTYKTIAADKNITGIAFNQPPIRGLSATGGVTFYLQSNKPNTVKQIYQDSIKLTQYLDKNYPQIANSFQFYNVDTPEIDVQVDPAKLYLYGLSYADLFNTMQATFGTYYVNYFTKWEDLWWVIMQADYKFRKSPDLLNTIYLKNDQGKIVPVGSVATINYRNGAEVVTRMNDFLASQIVVNPAPGYTSGEIMSIIKKAVPKVLGKDYTISWFGPAYQQNLAGATSTIAFVLGIIMVYLILAALYELWSLPLVIMMALPFALFGAALTLIIFDMPSDLYFKVSMLTLIGLSAKNAILITEFALDGIKLHGMTIKDAAIEAARIRFRPIIMTSIAFIFGSLPLVLAKGAGANAQHSVGMGIIGGMIGSTCIATLFVPLFFVIIMTIFYKNKKITKI